MNEDRRRARRFQMALPVEIKPPAPTGDTLRALTRDVSFRGLYFLADREFAPSSPIEFILTLPQQVTLAVDVRIHCVGRVVRVDRPGAAEFPTAGQVGIAAVIDRYEFLPSVAPTP